MRYLLGVKRTYENFQFLHVQLNVGLFCNYKCPYCFFVGHTDNEFRKDWEDVKEFLTRLQKSAQGANRVVDLTFIGGEPTLWPLLPEALKYCTSIGIDCSIFTNASAPVDFFDAIVPDLKYMSVSYHPCQETDDDAFFDKMVYLTGKVKPVVVNLILEQGYFDRVKKMADRCEAAKVTYLVGAVNKNTSDCGYLYDYTSEERALLGKCHYFDTLRNISDSYGALIVYDTDTRNLVSDEIEYNQIRISEMDRCHGMLCYPSWINIEYGIDGNTSVYRTLQRCPGSLLGDMAALKSTISAADLVQPIVCDKYRCACYCDLFQEKFLDGFEPFRTVDASVLSEIDDLKKSLDL